MNVTYEKKDAMTFIGYHTEIRPEDGYQKCPEFWDKEYASKYARLWQTMWPETAVEKACKRQVLFPKKWHLFFPKCGKLFSRVCGILFSRFYSNYGGWLSCPFRSAPVKGLSRHNGAPTPLFHDPLDRLAFLRSGIVPITGSQTYPKYPVIVILLYAGRPLHYFSGWL